jgi:hypothetical protein
MDYQRSDSSGPSAPTRYGLLVSLFLKTCLGLVLCFPLPSVFANNPGAFTNTVTTGGAVYQNTTGDANYMEVTCLRTFKPGTHKVVADIELQRALGKGNRDLYAYSVVRHPAAYAIHPDLNIGFIQCLFPTAHDSNNFLCENQYLDDGVKWGLSLNGVQQKRNGLLPKTPPCGG